MVVAGGGEGGINDDFLSEEDFAENPSGDEGVDGDLAAGDVNKSGGEEEDESTEEDELEDAAVVGGGDRPLAGRARKK